MRKEPSKKEEQLNQEILALLDAFPKAKHLAELILQDEEAHVIQEYANIVSVRRLGFNDHGPVHMRKATFNALTIMQLLRNAGIKTSLEQDEAGVYEDSLCAVVLAGFLHDAGMTITRTMHEETALILDYSMINRFLDAVYEKDPQRYIVRSLALEAILGHMANVPINSIEAGVILVADGCDMEKGRARSPFIRQNAQDKGRIGDIHRYSADEIESVVIAAGEEKPIRITVEMNTTVGLFQVEEILLKKVSKSPILPHIELYAIINGLETRRYL